MAGNLVAAQQSGTAANVTTTLGVPITTFGDGPNGVVFFLFHKPSAGAQAVATMDFGGNNFIQVVKKNLTDLGATIELYKCSDVNKTSSTYSVTFDKTVAAACVYRSYAGVVNSPKFCSPPTMIRGGISTSSSEILRTPSIVRRVAQFSVFAQIGSAAAVLANGANITDLNLSGFAIQANRNEAGGFMRLTGISSTAWVTCSVNVFTDMLDAGGGRHSSEEFFEEREKTMKRMADAEVKEDVKIDVQAAAPVSNQPQMSYEELLAIIRSGK